MDISTLVAIIPVILAAALIIVIVRRNLTEREPGQPLDIAGAIPAFVILMVAVILIGGMASSVAPYTWDEENGELTIKQDVGEGSQKWDSLGSNVKSLIITDKVGSVADGAFDTLMGLDYIEIPEGVSITSSAFGVNLLDYMDQQITEPPAGQYYGTGDGELYLLDDSIFRYSTNGGSIQGLTDSASSAVNLVIPGVYNGENIVSISSTAFMQNTTIQSLLTTKDSHLEIIYAQAFQGCSALAKLVLPPTLTSIRSNVFNGCAITELDLDGSMVINLNAFRSCTSLETVRFSAGITSIGTTVFNGCTAVTSVSFAEGFSPTLDATWTPWTFYASDGTTVIDSSDPANLAGKTFEGTASALVEVLPDRSALTPEQSLQVEELTKVALTKARTEISELDVGDKELQTFEIDASEQEKASA